MLRHGPAFILGGARPRRRDVDTDQAGTRDRFRDQSRGARLSMNFSTIASRAVLPFGTITACSTP